MAWALQGCPGSPGIAASAGASGSRAAAAIPAGTGCDGMWGHPPRCHHHVPAVPNSPGCSQCSLDPRHPEQAPLSHPRCPCHPQCLAVPSLSIILLAPFLHAPLSHPRFSITPCLPQSAPSVPMPPSPKSPHLAPDPSMPLHLPIPPEIPHHPIVSPRPRSPHPIPSQHPFHPQCPISPPGNSRHPLGDAPFVIVGSPLSGKSQGRCGCPLTALLEAVAAESGAELGAGMLGPLGWAQALVGGTGLTQCPVALGQLGQRLGIQQGLAAGGHGGGHGQRCRDNRAVGIPMSFLPTSAQATPGSTLGQVGRGHDGAAVLACLGRASWVLGYVFLGEISEKETRAPGDVWVGSREDGELLGRVSGWCFGGVSSS